MWGQLFLDPLRDQQYITNGNRCKHFGGYCLMPSRVSHHLIIIIKLLATALNNNKFYLFFIDALPFMVFTVILGPERSILM